MNDSPREMLVVLETDHASVSMDDLRKLTRITQVLEPRLALAEYDQDTMEAIAGLPGVLGVYDQPRPVSVPDATPAERTFVAAWELRQRPKTRPGQGLPWDAPGFRPPDGPPDSK